MAHFALNEKQRSFWFLENAFPGRGQTGRLFRISGNVDRERLERALEKLTLRHDILRASYTLSTLGPIQEIQSSVCVRVREVECQSLDDVTKYAIEDLSGAFDLSTPPLFRVSVARSGAESWLVVAIHHLVMDEWSLGVMLRDLDAIYSGRDLPAARSYLSLLEDSGPSTGGGGTSPHFHLPRVSSNSVEALSTSEADSIWVAPTAEVRHGIIAAAKSARTSEYMVWIHIVNIALSRLWRTREFALGLVQHGRGDEHFENVVGPCAEVLYCMAEIDSDQTFRDSLSAFRNRYFMAIEKAPVPWAGIASAERWPTVAFTQQLGVLTQNAIGPATLTDIPLNRSAAAFDLTFEFGPLRDLDESSALRIRFRRSFASASQIAGLRAEILAIAGCAGRGSSQKVSRLRADHEVDRSKSESERTSREHVLDQLDRWCLEKPDATFFTDANGFLSFRELKSRSTELANVLYSRGISCGDVVPIMFERSSDWVVSIVGILLCGAAFCPLDASWPRERILAVCGRLNSKCIVANSEVSSELPIVRPNSRSAVASNREWSKIRSMHAAFCVLATSGTTGNPKLVWLTHQNFSNILSDSMCFSAEATGNIAALADESFDAAAYEVVFPLYTGRSVVSVPRDIRLDVARLGSFVREHNVSDMFLTTAHARLISSIDPSALSSIRRLLVGGELAPASFFERLRGACPNTEIRHVYGPTETAVFCLRKSIGPADHIANTCPIGTATSGARIELLDDDGFPQRNAFEGEIVISGRQVALGYFGDPVATARAFRPDAFSESIGARCYLSGDIAFRDESGEVVFVGRRDNQVKIRGHRIELGEVETAASKLSGVRDVKCLAFATGETQIAMHYTGDLDEGLLRARLLTILPEYMVPSHIWRHAEFPLTSRGKIDVARLRQAVPNRITPEGPVTVGERALSAIAGAVLSLTDIDPCADFFRLGATSMTLMELRAELVDLFQMSLSWFDVYHNRTVRELDALFRARLPRQDYEEKFHAALTVMSMTDDEVHDANLDEGGTLPDC